MPTLDKIFEVAASFYVALTEQANEEEINGQTVTVFRGSMTKVWNEISTSQSYYVPVMAFLREYGYMTVIQKGSRGKDSVLVFHKPPERSEIEGASLTILSAPARLRADVERIEKRLGGIDIVEAFKNVESRLAKVEKTLYEKERNNGKTTQDSSKTNRSTTNRTKKES